MSLENAVEKHFVPQTFPFPFEPYGIQVDFMKNLYEAIENRKIGIFESPTGTGKSLSLICGSLTWLRDHEIREDKIIQELLETQKQASETSSGEVDWIQEFAAKQSVQSETNEAKKESERRKIRRKNLEAIRCNKETFDFSTKTKRFKRKRKNSNDETLDLIEKAKKEMEKTENESSPSIDEDLEDLVLVDYESNDEEETKQDDEDSHMTRIYFCSRTHSQLSQFVQELQKSPFGGALPVEDGREPFQVTMATLGSRNTLCINESVRKLKSLQLINDRCLEMQKNSNKKDISQTDPPKRRKRSTVATTTCSYYNNHKGASQLTNQIVAQVTDIEEVVKQGKALGACPYYASRRAVPFSQLVVLPYQSLLHRATREASGIELKDSVLIVDEAHNLIEAVNSMHSVKVTLKQLNQSHNQLLQYRQKFSKRLKAKNLFYVKQLLFVLKHLRDFIDTKPENPSTTENLLTINDFLFQTSLDNVNFFKLMKYCRRSGIAKKLSGFVEKFEDFVEKKSSLSTFLEDTKQTSSFEPITNSNHNVTMRSPLMHIESFLAAMTSSSVTGRVAMTIGDVERSLRFLLLNPSDHFKDILDNCRSLIFAGGTMQPSSCLIDQLLAQAGNSHHRSRIVEFSCGHVIDGAKQLLPLALSSGPSGEIFEFTYEKRGNPKLIDEIGRTLLNVSNLVPGGIVCFLPSYEYEAVVYKRWTESGILLKLEAKKKIFREPKKSDELQQVLNQYSKCIERTNLTGSSLTGAILLSVVGGKMSEGINFSDWLGRCVVMVGLPYPNLHSPELKEKINYLNKNMRNDISGRTAGQVHYEDLCMKAVNQSIGRAIRHRNDYSCVLLLDKRYHKHSVESKLPKWISEHLQKLNQFGKACVEIRKFFKDKKIS
uniref:Probable ATP-dependent RNA helicase DDX11 n=1 Tax=Phallusia mammillata TaxID=59560 RepID=A0A6F9DAV6_9ASCI|nr:probable ATP-dependent RNA helicase DDX11 [Phallusia mammillata]